MVGFWNLSSFPAELILNTLVYDAFPMLGQAKQKTKDFTKQLLGSNKGQPASRSGKEGDSKNVSLCSSWNYYFSHNMFTASLAYTMLWMTVLDNGSLMTSYLLWRKVPPVLFGFARGAGAIFGLMGTSVFFCIRNNIGSLEKSGVIAMWLFWLILAPGVLSFYFTGESKITDYVLMASMSIGRIGLWSFDLVITQLTQERVSEDRRGTFGSAQTASYQFFYVIINAMGIIFYKPSQFVVLVSYSVGVVLLAAFLYTKWYLTQQNSSSAVFSRLSLNKSNEMQTPHAISEKDAEYFVL